MICGRASIAHAETCPSEMVRNERSLRLSQQQLLEQRPRFGKLAEEVVCQSRGPNGCFIVRPFAAADFGQRAQLSIEPSGVGWIERRTCH